MSEVIEILEKVGAILRKSHFVGTSGLHFDTYINKDYLYPHTKETSRICELIAAKYQGKDIEVVVGPALGGIILSQWVTHHLNNMGSNAVSIYTEKTHDGGQIFTRGYDKLVSGKRVLVVEDSVQTGGSIIKVVKAVREAGGEVVGVCVIVNKDPEKINAETFRFQFGALAELPVQTYPAEHCPLCKKGVPINTTVGHGRVYLEKKS